MTTHGKAIKQSELFAMATDKQMEEINEYGADTVTVVELRLDTVFGANTFAIEHWEGYEMCFVDDSGRNITVNEKTLEVYEY